jgi:hypothetical protein
MRHRPGFPMRQASALICMASLIANVIKASSPRAARTGRTYGRTAPVWGQQRKKVSLTAADLRCHPLEVARKIGVVAAHEEMVRPNYPPSSSSHQIRLRRRRRPSKRVPSCSRSRPGGNAVRNKRTVRKGNNHTGNSTAVTLLHCRRQRQLRLPRPPRRETTSPTTRSHCWMLQLPSRRWSLPREEQSVSSS